jgi:ceramide glucosyltransferase
VDIALVVDGLRHGGNLKVANLQNMLPSASHDLIVMADSDMRVTQDYLAEITAPLHDPATGLVTCLYRGLPAGGVWSKLACAYINHGFLPQAVVAEEIGVGAGCFGATIALRRETLAAIGGFATIRDALADDHALGAAVRRAGLKVELSPYLVDNIIVEPSLSALFRHELRWARTIRIIAPAGFAASVVTQPTVLALAAVAIGTLPWAVAIGLLATALACRAVTVHLTDRSLRLRSTPLWLMPFRDMLSFAVFVVSFFSRTVAWRDRTFRIGKNGQMTLDGDKPA